MPAERSADKRITAYIRKQPLWAREICERLRKIAHKADRKMAEEWKWGPAFTREGIVCGFGAFKKWVTFTFREGAAMKDRRKLFNYGKKNDHNRSIKFSSAEEVKKHEKALVQYVQEAVKINLSSKKKAAKRKPKAKKPIVIPRDLEIALEGVGVLEAFKTLPYYMQRDSVMWIEGTKRMETRVRRIETLIAQVKYAKAPYG